MKANELRIGNYVKAPKGARYNNDVIQFGIHEFLKIAECVYDIEDFEPIPLTEEWLLKFGLTRIECNQGEYYPYTDINIVKVDEYYRLEVGSDEYVIGYKIKYVHQLQNLYFALTNKELTVK